MAGDCGMIANSPVIRHLTRASIRYAEAGWYVFPLPPRQKTPTKDSHGFHDATCDVEQVRAWWAEAPESNIGLWPGRSGFVVLDLDGPEAVRAAERYGVAQDMTLACVTGRAEGGRHLYFRHPGFHVGNGKIDPTEKRLEVRADMGYVVLPPSIHPDTGRTYRWHDRKTPIRELPDRMKDALRRASERDAEPQIPTTVGISPTGEELDRRVRAYMARVGNCGEGEGRNNDAFRIAAFATHDLAIDEMMMLAYLVEWNSGNAPPLSHRELASALRSGIKYGKRARGCGLERRICGVAARRARPLPVGEPPASLVRAS
jgi:bifunctional DNA primase/polymerase-like protein